MIFWLLRETCGQGHLKRYHEKLACLISSGVCNGLLQCSTNQKQQIRKNMSIFVIALLRVHVLVRFTLRWFNFLMRSSIVWKISSTFLIMWRWVLTCDWLSTSPWPRLSGSDWSVGERQGVSCFSSSKKDVEDKFWFSRFSDTSLISSVLLSSVRAPACSLGITR